MFLALLVVTLVTATAVSFLVARAFDKSINRILERIIHDDIANAWAKYLTFAIYVVGISGGVGIYQLERYITADYDRIEPLVLTTERWILEIYRTIISSLQAIATMLLVFFIFALIAYVIVSWREQRVPPKPS